MNRIEFGDCIELMRAWPAGIAQTCVTSPPYFGLRDYGHAGQIGLEQTPNEYVAKMVEVFREVRRVLRDDGTLWLNLGDSYAGGGGGNYNTTGKTRANGCQVTNVRNRPEWLESVGAKPKDLLGIPWRVAFALQADGWYLRQDIIWHKPNPMPESVRDRCTKAHEYIFLLTKNQRYYFDSEAMKEPSRANPERMGGKFCGQSGYAHSPNTNGNGGLAARARSARDSFKRDGSKRAEVIPGQSVGIHRPDRAESEHDVGTRNRRSVWTVATRPYKGAHFATYPYELIEPCIKAGSRPGDVVLDPFMGSGTTAYAALTLGRQYLGCEVNPSYGPLQQQRIAEATVPRSSRPKPSKKTPDQPQSDLFAA